MRSLVAAIVGACACVVGGCAPTRDPVYLASFAAGERAFHAGRWVEAAMAWEDAASRSAHPRDRDEARFLEARAFERAERWPDARATLTRLAAETPPGERSGRAVFDLATLEIQHGDAERGYAMLDAAMLKLPEHGVARVALRRLVRHAADVGGEPAIQAFLDAHEAALKSTTLDEVVAYERAESLERSGKKKLAHDAYMDTAHRHPYPKGGLTDDAYYHAAVIDEEEGRYEEAIAHLREMLSFREPPSLKMGFERPRFSAAQFHIAEIYRDRLHDHAAARRELEKFYDVHRTATARAKAVWEEARLASADGDHDAACALAKRLRDEFPDSRYVACAPSVCREAPAGAHACAEYLLRAPESDTPHPNDASP